MTVSIAVTNSASIWTPRNVPRMAKMPTTTMMSWSRATSAVAPNLMLWKRTPIQIRIPSEPTRISRIACWISSDRMIGPTVVVRRTQEMGPRVGSACMALAMSAILPTVGIGKHVVLPNTVAGLGDGLGEAEGLGLGVALAVGLGDGVGEGLEVALAEPDALEVPGALDVGLGLAVGAVDAVAEALTLAEALALADAEALPVAVALAVGSG